MNASECIAAMQSNLGSDFVVLSSVTFYNSGDMQKGFVFGYKIRSQDSYNNTTTLNIYIAQFVNGGNRITDTAYKTYRIRYGDNVYEGSTHVNDDEIFYGWVFRGNPAAILTVPNDQSVLLRLWVALSTGSFTSCQCEATKFFTVERRSTLTVPSLTLGSASTLTITRKTYHPTHTVKYRLVSSSTWTDIVTNAGAGDLSWIPPLTLANSYPDATTVPVTIRLITYTDSGWGYFDYDVSIAIPASVIPAVSVAVSDGNGYAATYGNYLHNRSTYAVDVTATPAYSSAIVSYSTVISGQTINGNAFTATYTGSSFTTDILELVGTVTITTSVTDARGRIGTATKTVTAIQYTPPLITALSTHRCNSDGTENDQGEYVSFTFSAAVQALSNINTATYWYKYKSSADSSYTSVALPDIANNYSVIDYTVIIAADSSYTYDIVVCVQDGVMTTERSVQASTAATILNLHSSGTGLAVGKVAEEENLFDVGLPMRVRESIALDDTPLSDLVTAMKFSIVDTVYPVGSVYISVISTSPATLFGGTWERLKDTFLLAAGDTYANGATGGAATHTLTEAQLPAHNHNVPLWEGHCTETGTGSLYYSRRSDLTSRAVTSDPKGSGQAHNNMPPYLVVYMWKRTV